MRGAARLTVSPIDAILLDSGARDPDPGARFELSHRRGAQRAGLRPDLRGRRIAAVRRALAQRSPDRRRLQHLSRHAHDLRGLHHLDLQRQLHRPRARDRPADAGLPAFLSRALPGHDRRDEPRARRQQYRPDVGRPGGRDAVDRDDGRHLPHSRSGRGGVEIFHPRFASASRSRSSAPSWSTSWRRRCSARACRPWPGT